MSIEDERDEFIELRAVQALTREKIIHVLTVWPRLSPSMLQIGLGTGLSSRLWRPILETLITEGIVIREEVTARSPIGRDQSYTILSLNPDSSTSS